MVLVDFVPNATDYPLQFPDVENLECFKLPERAILTLDDLGKFKESSTFKSFVGFILQLNAAVEDKEIAPLQETFPENVALAVRLLDTTENWINDFPAVDNSKSRFGNPSFQRWFDCIADRLPQLYEPFFEYVNISDKAGALRESFEYYLHSFGSRKRIDYGTGHEANFICWLYCMTAIGVFSPTDFEMLVLVVFRRYITLMRRLQEVYWLEPAGSHGVWGLDDFHFLTFMFGSSQLAHHKYLKPKSIHDAQLVADLAPKYMYYANILWIQTSKSAPGLTGNPHSLRWHSPMLDDISGVKRWAKVNSGMIKMYVAEVLGKLPIMQHFLFGSILPLETSGHVLAESDEQFHVHAMGQEFPGCCGVRIPSAVAAQRAKDKRAFIDASATGGPKVDCSETVVHRVGNVAETGQLRKPTERPTVLEPIPKPKFVHGSGAIPFD